MIYTIEEITKRIRPVVEKYGLRSVYLFGSYARGDATDESDVDLLVDTGGEAIGMFRLGGIYGDLCDALEKEVDLVTLDSFEESRNEPLYKRFVQEVELDRRLLIS